MSDSIQDNSQAERFLTRLQSMSSDSRAAFELIYALAPKGQPRLGSAYSGPHVRLAMMEALVHPDIAYWVRMNLAIRVTRKFSQTAGLHEKAQRLSTLLEDFHVATDAFMHQTSVERARSLRQRKATTDSTTTPSALIFPFESGVSADQLAIIQEFKQQIIPGFIHAIRQKYIKTA